MLDESEWEEILPHLTNMVEQSKRYREGHDASLAEAIDHVDRQGALGRYNQITGFQETNVNAIWHHRLSNFGPACGACGKPLRTPRAKLCAECGAPR